MILFHLVVTDPVGDVTNFISSFESKFGQYHPVFYQGTYSQVRSCRIYLCVLVLQYEASLL